MLRKLQEDATAPGIWRFHSYLCPIDPRFRLSLGEGGTKDFIFDSVIFKREDQNPTGSLKDRGLAYQISSLYQKGERNLVISSSGNAAISAAAYCQLADIELNAFVSPKINRAKLAKIKDYGAKVFTTARPVSDAFKYAKEKGWINLRSSVEETGAEGYKTLAFEIYQKFGKVDSVFIPVSSGTALCGIAEGFRITGHLPKFHIVQTPAVCFLASNYDKEYEAAKASLADALVAKSVPRRKQVHGLIKESEGFGWVINDNQIIKSWEELLSAGICTSAEGAAAFAAIKKARAKGKNIGGKVVCLLTGKRYSI